MLRLKVILLLVFAVVLSIEPTLHNHPLIPAPGGDAAATSASATCTACLFGTIGLTRATALPSAPDHVAYAVAVAPILVPAAPFALSSPSRGPPSVA